MAGTQARQFDLRQFDEGQLERTRFYRAATAWMLGNYNSLETDRTFAFLYRLDQRLASLGVRQDVEEVRKALFSGRMPRLDDGLVHAALTASDKVLRAHAALLEKQKLGRDETLEAVRALLPDDPAGRKIVYVLYEPDMNMLLAFVGPRNPVAVLTGAAREDMERLRGQGLIDGVGVTQKARDLLDFRPAAQKREAPEKKTPEQEAPRGLQAAVYDWDACVKHYEDRNAICAKERGELAYLGQLRGVFRLATQNPGLPFYRFMPPSYLTPRNLMGYPFQYRNGMTRRVTLAEAFETVEAVRQLQRMTRKNIEPDSAAQWAVAAKHYQQGTLASIRF